MTLPATVQSAPNGDRFPRLDAMLDKEARELMMPGVSAALMEGGKLEWTGARGWADIEAHRPVTPDTPFNIASLTKPMTSVMLMQLVERGALSLDTPMQRYDPSYNDARVTVSHVLSMTAEGEPPGQRYAYSGNVYGTLGNVVTGAAHETLAQAFSADAQGLSSERAAHYQAIFGRVARPYNVYGGAEFVLAYPPDATPNAAANVISTASDYAGFADAVMRGKLLSRAAQKTMWTPHVTAKGEQLPYAYGWFVEDYRGHRLIYHYGYYDNAYSAVALIVPGRQLVFVGLSNGGALSGHNGIDRVEGNALACAVLVDFVDAALPCSELAAANVAKWKARFPPPEPEMASDPATLPRYGGSYRRPAGDEAQVLIDQGRLWWQSPAGRFPLTQLGPDRFVMKTDNRIMKFVFDKSGHVTRIDVTYPGDATVYALPRL
jgi:CubicO group peptidase (beta-lactamase class C family)